MSHLICNNCGHDMGEYMGEVTKIEECTRCASKDLNRVLILADNVSIHEMVKGKTNKMPGKKKPSKEFQVGEEWSVCKKDYVCKERYIDRANDQYYEKVTDSQSGEVIHECEEALSEHYGHGSAKCKKCF